VNQEAPIRSREQTKPLANLRWIALGVLLLATIAGVFGYWRYTEIYPGTQNAYTGTHIVRVAPQVAGSVENVYVRSDEAVGKDDPLFELDPGPYDAALRAARAQFDAAAAAAGAAGDNLRETAATLDERLTALTDAAHKYEEAVLARPEGGEPTRAMGDALAAWHEALREFRAAQEDFSKAQDEELTIAQPTVQLRSAAAALDRAARDRARTHVAAPAAGLTGEVTLRPGAAVSVGMPVFPIIQTDQWWVDANFKETDINRIRPGQKAWVRLDMYPDLTLDGEVESIRAGSGAVFSLLPPENATGNWVKVSQRFPVRIRIAEPPQDAERPLRVGASAYVTVDTTQNGD
jgi:membrane fusion protein, multidrug efflux system